MKKNSKCSKLFGLLGSINASSDMVWFKNGFLAIFEIAKNGIWSKNFFVKLIYLISRGFFLVWTFLNFLAHLALDLLKLNLLRS